MYNRFTPRPSAYNILINKYLQPTCNIVLCIWATGYERTVLIIKFQVFHQFHWWATLFLKLRGWRRSRSLTAPEHIGTRKVYRNKIYSRSTRDRIYLFTVLNVLFYFLFKLLYNLYITMYVCNFKKSHHA